MIKSFEKLYKKISDNNIINIFYLIGIAIFAFSRIYQYSLIFNFTNIINSILRIICFLLLLPKVIFQKYNKSDLYILTLLFTFTITCIVFGGDNNLIIIPCILCGIKDIDIKRVIKIIFIINISALIIHFIYFVINYYLINGEIQTIFHFMWTDGNNNLMYANRNMFAIRYLCALMQYIYLTNRNENRYIKAFIALCFSIFVYQISNSRVCFLMCLLVLIYFCFEKCRLLKHGSNSIKLISLLFSIFFTSFMIFVGKRIENPFYEKIDNLLAWRPHYLSQMCDYVGINIFPSIEKFNNIKDYFGNNVVIVPDNSYIALLLKWGILITTLLLIIVMYFAFIKKQDQITNFYISIMLLLFTMEYISNEYIIYIVPLLVMNNIFNKKI